MTWKKISASNELISFEKNKKDVSIRIEASPDKRGNWNIYKVYYDKKGMNYNEEFFADNKVEAENIINELKSEQDLSLNQIKQIESEQNKKLSFEIKRAWAEGDVEKWHFGVNSANKLNFLIISFGESIELDVVMHQRYKHLKEKIISKIIDTFNLNNLTDEIIWNFYFFNRDHKNKQFFNKSSKDMLDGVGVLISKIGIELSKK